LGPTKQLVGLYTTQVNSDNQIENENGIKSNSNNNNNKMMMMMKKKENDTHHDYYAYN
jgi:hypothetical protein